MLYDSIVDIFGKYSPIEVTSGSAISGSGSIAYVDFTYIFMIIVFSIAFLSLFRIIGGVFHNGKSHRI